MKQYDTKVIFNVHPAIEFIYALNFIANEEASYKGFSDMNFVPDEEFKKLIEQMKGKLSRFLRNELIYFFGWSDLGNILFRITVESDAVKDVSELLKQIEQMSEEKLLSFTVRQVLLGDKADNEAAIQQLSASDLRKLIRDADNKSDQDKEILIEFMENPSEIRSRLCFLLAQFYEKCYKSLEDDLLVRLSAAKERYERLFHDDPECFNNEYIGKLLERRYETLVIHISYFTQIRAWMFDVKPLGSTQWISLGIHTEHYPRREFIKSKVQKFIKILSDKKRFEMIELLGKRPYYVYELSTELELTSPTVCYHLNSMLDLNLVSLDRGNNRTFYTLNKDTIKELLDNAAELLLETR